MNEDFADYEHKQTQICQLTNALDNQVHFADKVAPDAIAFRPQVA